MDYNADQTFSITPDDPVTYEIEDVTVNGSSVGAVSGYTFTDVTSDQTIHATFRLKPVITATAGENGSISPPGTVIVDYNADQTFSITTDDPVTYEIEDVTVNGSSVGAVSGYTFTDVTSDQTIHATFRLKPVITASVGDNGSISPSGSVVVSHGADQSFTMTPADGYEVEDVTVGGVSVGAVTHHTLENVTGDTAIHATFKEVTTYDLVITMTEHGKVRVEIDGVETLLTVSDTLTVESGQSIYCEIMPDTDYYASEIIKDGTYSTTNLETWFYADEEHSLDVTFSEAGTHDITVTATSNGSVEVQVNGELERTVTSATDTIQVNSGDDVYCYLTPGSGYYASDVVRDGESSSYGDFDHVLEDHTFEVTFSPTSTHDVAVNAAGGGSVEVRVNGSVVGTVTDATEIFEITSGDDIRFEITPDADHYLASILLNGEPESTWIHLGNVDTNQVLDVTFAEIVPCNFQINITGSGTVYVEVNGVETALSANGTIAMNTGDYIMYRCEPDADYYTRSLIMDGEVTDDYTYMTANGDHTLDVTFISSVIPAPYDLTVTVNGSGAVEVSIDGTSTLVTSTAVIPVNSGDSVWFNAAANAGHRIETMEADGDLFSMGGYWGTIINNVHSLDVTFVEDPAVVTYDIDTTIAGSGSVSVHVNNVEVSTLPASGIITVNEGDRVRCYFDPASGYYPVSVTADGTAVDPTSSHDFGYISENHELNVTFEAEQNHTLDVTLNGDGMVRIDVNGEPEYITSDASVEIQAGDGVYFSAKAGVGCRVDEVLKDGFASTSSGTISNMRSLDVAFVEDPSVVIYDFDITVNGSGTVSVVVNGLETDAVSTTDVVTVNEYDQVYCYFIPGLGYQLNDVVIDDVSVGAVSQKSFWTDADHTVDMILSEVGTYDITVTATSGGSVLVRSNNIVVGTVSGATEVIQVTSGDDVRCEVTPDAGYYASDVVRDGESSSYEWFGNVESDHTFEVTFSETAIHDITVTSGGSGSVTVYVNGEPERTVSNATEIIQVTSGDDVLCEVTPDADYYASSIIGSTWLWNVETDHTFEVTFSETAIHDITVTSGGSGSVTVYVNGEPERTVSNATEIIQVTSGDDVLCEVTPDADYYASDVVRDGESSSYEWFFDVDSDHDFEVTFAEIVSCELSITATDNGSVTVYVNDVESGTITNGTDTISVNSDDDVRCEFTADAGYYASAVIDGSSYNYGSSGNRYFYPVDGAHEIDVNFLPTYTITTTAGEHGTVTPTFTVNEGGNAWISIEPDEGYVIDTLRVDGTLTEPTSMYFFADVHENHTLDVTFREAVVYDIALTISGSGNIETKTDVYFDGDSISVTEGSYVTLKINADDGHKINAITVDGSAFDPTKSYRFHSVTENHSFAVTFVPGTAYEVSVVYVSEEWSEGGTINPDSIMIDEGLSQTFTANPEDGFKVLNLVVDDESLGAQASYDFTAIDSDHTIGATYASAEAVLYQISVSVAGLPNGQIYPCYGDVNVPEGEMQHFSFEPDDGYQAVVLVDGEEVDVSWWGYVFESVTADGHTVDVSFVSE